ncbi:MAG: DnaJ like chaperone protein [Chloroflexota bacterium]|nr:DnaJ like chaperone protein [Chloroflexota bacterium]
MTRREPHSVLGLKPGASASAIKAAWRRLAREHHPDRSGSDTAATHLATKRMAEINAAYEQLTDRGRPGRTTAGGTSAERRPSGPPSPRPTRPVTARLDTSDILRPRNATTHAGRPAHPPGQPPIRSRASATGPRRASDPNGPLVRSRVRRFKPPRQPSLEAAKATEMPFGKFHGHTLGDIAAFEPSYIDWMASTILRDPDLLAAARVVREDLDRRGIVRRTRPSRVPPGPPTD